MDNKSLLDNILEKEGANEAFQQLTSQFNINDSMHIQQNWADVEDFLVNFKFKRYRISQDHLFSEIVIQPFKNEEELQKLKRYLIN